MAEIIQNILVYLSPKGIFKRDENGRFVHSHENGNDEKTGQITDIKDIDAGDPLFTNVKHMPGSNQYLLESHARFKSNPREVMYMGIIKRISYPPTISSTLGKLPCIISVLTHGSIQVRSRYLKYNEKDYTVSIADTNHVVGKGFYHGEYMILV